MTAGDGGSGGDGVCSLLGGFDGVSDVHDDAVSSGWTCGHAGVEVVGEVEFLSDLEGVRQVLGREGDGGGIAFEGDGDLEGGSLGSVDLVGEGHLTGLPGEDDEGGVSFQGAQPSDDGCAVGFLEGGGFGNVAWHDLLIAWIVAIDEPGNECVGAGAELDVAGVFSVGDHDGRVARGEVFVGEDMHGGGRQEEVAIDCSCRCCGETTAVGGHGHASFLGSEADAVEDVTGCIGGETWSDGLDRLHGGFGKCGDASSYFGPLRVFGSGFGLIVVFHRQAAGGGDDPELGLLGCAGTFEAGAAVAICFGQDSEGRGRQEETRFLRSGDGGRDAGFEPVVEIGDGEGEHGVVDGDQDVREHGKRKPIEADPGEELAGGFEVGNGDFNHGDGQWFWGWMRMR